MQSVELIHSSSSLCLSDLILAPAWVSAFKHDAGCRVGALWPFG